MTTPPNHALTANPAGASQMSVDAVAAWTSFIAKAQLDVRALDLFEQLIQVGQSAPDDSIGAQFIVLRGNGHGDAFLMDVQSNVMHDFIHGCLFLFTVEYLALFNRNVSSTCGSAPHPWGNPRYIRNRHPLHRSFKP